MELVTGDQVAAWILIAFLVGYFIYKEWPEFSRRVSGEAVEKEMPVEVALITVENAG